MKNFNDLPETEQKNIIEGAMKHSKKLQDKVLEAHTDWEKFEVAYWINELIEKRCDRVFCRKRIEEIQERRLADARREVIDFLVIEISKMKRDWDQPIDEMPETWFIHNEAIDKVLATLKKEEK